MSKVYLLVSVALFLGYLSVSAQNDKALAINMEKRPVVRVSEVGNSWEFLSGFRESFSDEEMRNTEHFLGNKVGCMLQCMKEAYFRKEEVVPGDPQTRTLLLKPEIYKSVVAIEKYLKKCVKEKTLERAQAEQDFTHVLQVALAAVDTEQTESFENELQKNKKDQSNLICLFKRVKVKSIY